MRILLDESLPRRLKRELAEHDAMTVPEAGWASKKNGELLRLAVEKFDVFITADQNMPYQQNLKNFKIAIVLLQASSNRFGALKPLMPRVLQALETIQSGEIVTVSA